MDKRGFRFGLPGAQVIRPDDATLLCPQGRSCPEERALPGLLVGQLTPVVLHGGPRVLVHFKAPHLARGVPDPAVGAAVADVDGFHGADPLASASRALPAVIASARCRNHASSFHACVRSV